MRGAFVLLGLLSCTSARRPPLSPAGDKRDDGNGQLASASMQLYTDEETPEQPPPREDAYEDAYGGTTYGGYTAPNWTYPSVNRNPAYTVKNDLAGAVEGTISWRGATPTATTSCGPVEWLRVGPHRELAGALVFIHRVATGRALIPVQSEQRPATVGGLVVKHGCALFPVVQLVTPVPARIVIHGDRTATRLRLTTTSFPPPALPGAPAERRRTFAGDVYQDWEDPPADDEVVAVAPVEPREVDLLEGGRAVAPIRADIMRIDSVDNTVGSAWVLGMATPAYAITDEAGRFRLDELAKGTYEVTIWVPPPPAAKNGALVYGDPVIIKRTVTVSDGPRATHLDVTVGK